MTTPASPVPMPTGLPAAASNVPVPIGITKRIDTSKFNVSGPQGSATQCAAQMPFNIQSLGNSIINSGFEFKFFGTITVAPTADSISFQLQPSNANLLTPCGMTVTADQFAANDVMIFIIKTMSIVYGFSNNVASVWSYMSIELCSNTAFQGVTTDYKHFYRAGNGTLDFSTLTSLQAVAIFNTNNGSSVYTSGTELEVIPG